VTANDIAVVVAHPDDEVLGFGGMVARSADAGIAVHILVLATGLAARGAVSSGAVTALREQASRATEVLGAASIEFADFPDNRMDTVPLLDVVQRIEAFLAEHPAGAVYSHFSGDLNVDHRVVSGAVATACRPLPNQAVRRLYAGEVLSSTEWSTDAERFRPSVYLGIAKTLERKLEALACYTDEAREFPHPRSTKAVRALAELRGSESGLPAAEAFRLERLIEH